MLCGECSAVIPESTSSCPACGTATLSTVQAPVRQLDPNVYTGNDASSASEPPERQSGENIAATRSRVPSKREQRMPEWQRGVALVAIVASLAGGAYMLSQDDTPDSEVPSSSSTTTSAAQTIPTTPPAPVETTAAATGSVDPTDGGNVEVTEITDPVTGISLSYPEGWTPVELTPTGDPEIRLFLQAGGQESLLARALPPLAAPVETDEDLININAVTDGLIDQVEGARVLVEEQVELGGLDGYYYVYEFTDAQSGLTGIHAHYFLFEGVRWYSLTFQVLPAENLEPMAADIDLIAESFRVDAPP